MERARPAHASCLGADQTKVNRGGYLAVLFGERMLNGDLIALSAEDGAELWRINIMGESLTRPLIKDDAGVV